MDNRNRINLATYDNQLDIIKSINDKTAETMNKITDDGKLTRDELSKIDISIVKSIQRGIVDINKGLTSIDIPILTIDANKSMVLLTGIIKNVNGEMHGLLGGLTSNKLTITLSNDVSYSVSNKISWQVIEFN